MLQAERAVTQMLAWRRVFVHVFFPRAAVGNQDMCKTLLPNAHNLTTHGKSQIVIIHFEASSGPCNVMWHQSAEFLRKAEDSLTEGPSNAFAQAIGQSTEAWHHTL